jgi:Phosphoserine phosphatase RsbU, N-terminal domain/GAF domain
VIAAPADLQQRYRSAFDAYLRAPSEAALRAAYELGRDAMGRELSILDLAALHHEALLAALEHASPSAGEVGSLVQAANDFFLETLSAFEMLRRGFREAQEAALVEKRHALILRQLSTFLADASLALNATDSLGEVLQLVAEQARELTGAECSVASARIEGAETQTIEAISHSETDASWQEFVAKTNLTALSALVDPPKNAARLGRADLADQPTWTAAAGNAREVRTWLAATLTGWDGRTLGSIQLFDKANGDFSEADEAVLVHLAQMAATAVERARRSA